MNEFEIGFQIGTAAWPMIWTAAVLFLIGFAVRTIVHDRKQSRRPAGYASHPVPAPLPKVTDRPGAGARRRETKIVKRGGLR